FEINLAGTDPFNADTLGTGAGDGALDSDLDGKTNLEEFLAGTNPHHPDISLSAGLNLFSYPVESAANFSAFDLLAELGGPAVVERALKYDPAAGQYLEARYNGTNATGTDFPVSGGDGLLLYLKSDYSKTFTGSVSL